MAPLTTSSRTLLRTCQRQPLKCLAPALSTAQRRGKADIVERHSGEYERTPRYESPFANKDDNPTTKIPSFAKYMSKKGETSNKTFQYFMVGGMGLLAAAGAKATVQGEDVIEWSWDGFRSQEMLEEARMNFGNAMADNTPSNRFPSEHVRLRRRARPSQSRDRSRRYPRRQKRTAIPLPPKPSFANLVPYR